MSAGVCGKRLGLEDLFGSAAPAPAAKRSRCSPYGSPIRSPDLGFGFEDKASILLRMFPSMDRRVVESVLNSHDQKIEDAIKSLRALCVDDGFIRNEAVNPNSAVLSNGDAIEGGMNAQQPDLNTERMQDGGLDSMSAVSQNGSSWVDLFVQEMMNASDWDAVQGRAIKLLEAFEKSVHARSTASEPQEITTLKEQLQCLLRDNQILKRAVAIQHEHNLEHEEKLKEVQQLKHILSQYQEQVRNLELNNYSLKIHLQRAQGSSSIPSHFHPDIF